MNTFIFCTETVIFSLILRMEYSENSVDGDMMTVSPGMAVEMDVNELMNSVENIRLSMLALREELIKAYNNELY